MQPGTRLVSRRADRGRNCRLASRHWPGCAPLPVGKAAVRAGRAVPAEPSPPAVRAGRERRRPGCADRAENRPRCRGRCRLARGGGDRGRRGRRRQRSPVFDAAAAEPGDPPRRPRSTGCCRCCPDLAPADRAAARALSGRARRIGARPTGPRYWRGRGGPRRRPPFARAVCAGLACRGGGHGPARSARPRAGSSGKIDRLAVTPDKVLIVDYKTNRPAPAALDDVPRGLCRARWRSTRAAAAALSPSTGRGGAVVYRGAAADRPPGSAARCRACPTRRGVTRVCRFTAARRRTTYQREPKTRR